jgi:hypothetical protein
MNESAVRPAHRHRDGEARTGDHGSPFIPTGDLFQDLAQCGTIRITDVTVGGRTAIKPSWAERQTRRRPW